MVDFGEQQRLPWGWAFWLLYRRAWLKILRRPVTLTFSLVQPLIWMTFFGFLFERFADSRALDGLDYLSFVAPGLSVMTVLLGASQAGVSIIRDDQTGYLQRMLYSRASPAFVLGAKIAADSTRLMIQALIVLLLAMGLGGRFQIQLAHLPFAAFAVLTFAFGMSSLSCWVAAIARDPTTMGTYVHLINMPLLFTSTALVPSRQMPEWLASIAAFNPMSFVVDLWRATWLGSLSPRFEDGLLLGLVTVGWFFFATRALSKIVGGRW